MPATKKKSTTTKKTTPKRAPSKTSSTRVTRVARQPKQEMRSFRPASTREPFFTFRITHQTLYWLILAVLVLGLALWVSDISVKVQKIYDQIDQTNQQMRSLDDISVKK